MPCSITARSPTERYFGKGTNMILEKKGRRPEFDVT